MNHRLQTLIEQHPALGFLASGASVFTGVTRFLVEHADDGAKVFGAFAAIFGCIAGYYTMRLQRRAWKRGQTRPPLGLD